MLGKNHGLMSGEFHLHNIRDRSIGQSLIRKALQLILIVGLVGGMFHGLISLTAWGHHP